MKRIASYIIISLFSAALAFAEGIGSAFDLAAYAKACNEGTGVDAWVSEDGVVRLTADIDMSKQKNMPQFLTFGGILDGCGHSIKGWKTSDPLIRTIGSDAKISNLVFASDCVLKPSPKADLQHFGFLAAENFGTVVSCVNEGSIIYKSGYCASVLSIGGLVGTNYYVVFDCANYGSIKADVISAQHIFELPMNVGGVVGEMGNDAVDVAFIAACYNFGNINVSCDTPVQNIGGVIGNAAKRTVKYCVNKGTVSCYSPKGEQAKSAPQSRVGGVVGFTKSDVMACDNFGVVTTQGASVGSAGGIVGMPHAALVVGDCVNYGAISTGNDGGNNCGGIAGNVGRPVHFKRCINRGPARKGIAGNVYRKKGVTEDASFKDCVDLSGGRSASLPDWANGAEPMSNGANVYGQVMDSEGKPVPGVVVSDGFTSVCTGMDGVYMMRSNMDAAKFVQISLPAEYEIPSINGAPVFFRRIPRYCKAVRADFVLTPRAEVNDNYTLAMIADPQVRPVGMDGSMEVWRDDVSTDVETLRKNTQGEFYCINLGDLVYNYMYAYDDYLAAAANIKCPMFNVIGNHDYDQKNILRNELGQIYFQTYVGPVNYSFNIGKLHYIVMNNIMYDRANREESYSTGIDDASLAWLKSDLRYVPTDRVLVICAHAQFFKRDGESLRAFGGRNRNFDEYKQLLIPYKHIYSWSGHYHLNFFCDYASHPEFAERFRADNITSVCVSRCTGALRLNKYLNNDGTPQGYMVVNVKGEDMDWCYKSVGHDFSYQMKIYDPSRSEDGHLRVIIWNWNENWTLPQLWQNGEKVCDMALSLEPDPDYALIFKEITNEKVSNYCKPSDKCLIFRADTLPLKGEYEVRVKDNFGKEYSQIINL